MNDLFLQACSNNSGRFEACLASKNQMKTQKQIDKSLVNYLLLLLVFLKNCLSLKFIYNQDVLVSQCCLCCIIFFLCDLCAPLICRFNSLFISGKFSSFRTLNNISVWFATAGQSVTVMLDCLSFIFIIFSLFTLMYLLFPLHLLKSKTALINLVFSKCLLFPL